MLTSEQNRQLVFWTGILIAVIGAMILQVAAVHHSLECDQKYGFEEGYAGAKSGLERHENPYDGRRSEARREAWDQGFVKFQSEVEMKESTKKKISDAIANWDDPESPARKRFDAMPPVDIDEVNAVEKKPTEVVGPLSLNTYIRFKMTARGLEIAKAYFAKIDLEYPNVLFKISQSDVECRLQLHDLFRIFGGDHFRYDAFGSPIYDLIVESSSL